jgi:molecular chaperone GrpE
MQNSRNSSSGASASIWTTAQRRTARHLDGLLAGYQVRALDAVGKRIKPESMQVTAIQHRDDREDGIVLEEVRKGFLRAGQVLRPAEVIVNKRQTPL